MEEHVLAVLGFQLKTTIKHLQERGFDTFVCERSDEVLPLLDTLIQDGNTVAHGGSMTLEALGVIPYLRKRNVTYYDRYAKNLDEHEKQAMMRQAFDVDTYLMSSSAITEAGEIYNVDGIGNRLAALMFGPKQVCIIVGINKLVSDLDAARNRMRTICAPANAHRLKCNTPCVRTGRCMDCRSSQRICIQELVTSWQRIPHRTKIIFVKAELGY